MSSFTLFSLFSRCELSQKTRRNNSSSKMQAFISESRVRCTSPTERPMPSKSLMLSSIKPRMFKAARVQAETDTSRAQNRSDITEVASSMASQAADRFKVRLSRKVRRPLPCRARSEAHRMKMLTNRGSSSTKRLAKLAT